MAFIVGYLKNMIVKGRHFIVPYLPLNLHANRVHFCDVISVYDLFEMCLRIFTGLQQNTSRDPLI